MPISPITLQRRHAELGRIRLGRKVGGNGRPEKLGAFRFTSPSERYITDLAELYGGTPQPWDNNGKPEFEVFSVATTMPVIVVKGGLSQWMELWSGGGVTHRCDGVRDVEGNLCNPEDPKHQAAKPTTRLSVMLPELEAVGVFRMESHGWNAAAEIPAVAELAQFVGDLVPAHLNLVERRAIKDGKTSRFVVPVLDLQIGTARLRQLVAERSGMAELEGPSQAPALSARRPEYRRLADIAPDLDTWRDVWNAARDAGHLDEDLKAYLTERGNALRAENPGGDGEGEGAVRAAPSPNTPDADGVVDAELVVDEANPDKVWEEIVRVGGQCGITLPDLQDDVAAFLGGTSAGEASGAELQAFLDDNLLPRLAKAAS